MDELTLARAIHVIAVVAWIGGVYLVTMVILPAGREGAICFEPWFLHDWFSRRVQVNSVSTFILVTRFHQFLLLLSLAVIVGAVMGSH